MTTRKEASRLSPPERGEELPLFSRPSGPAQAPPPAGPVRRDTAISAAVNAWGEALESSGRSIHTVKAFTADLRLLAKFVGGGTPVGAVATHDIRNFLDWMLHRRKAPCSPKTYARRVTSVKAFFRWLIEAGVLDEDPAAPIPQQTVLSPLPQVLSPDEVQAALDAAAAWRQADKPDARPFTLLSLLLQTGIKKNECLTIHLNHIDLTASEGPTLFVRYGEVRKRYRERKLRLDEAWAKAYREYLSQYAPRDRVFPYSPRRLEYLLEDIGEAAGLEKHLSFNMCRWTSALGDIRDSVDRDQIRQKLGLSKIQWREVGVKLDRLAAGDPE
ncbi:MAG: tyrosine-type recombinase/integrase [Anaerolineales bacterium]|nr:tyrosine-type recombinase/integrase [Anaerolineales bacterium]